MGFMKKFQSQTFFKPINFGKESEKCLERVFALQRHAWNYSENFEKFSQLWRIFLLIFWKVWKFWYFGLFWWVRNFCGRKYGLGVRGARNVFSLTKKWKISHQKMFIIIGILDRIGWKTSCGPKGCPKSPYEQNPPVIDHLTLKNTSKKHLFFRLFLHFLHEDDDFSKVTSKWANVLKHTPRNRLLKGNLLAGFCDFFHFTPTCKKTIFKILQLFFPFSSKFFFGFSYQNCFFEFS